MTPRAKVCCAALTALLACAAHALQDPPRKAPDPTAPRGGGPVRFELRLAVDERLAAADRIRLADEKQMEEQLRRRLPLLGVKQGEVQVTSARDIRVRVAADQLSPAQMNGFARGGRIEVRHLRDVQSQFRAEGRYALETVTIMDARETRSVYRFRDRRSGTPYTPEEFLQRCPVVVTAADVLPGSAEVVRTTLFLAVRVQFRTAGSLRLAQYLKKEGEMLATALDGQLISLNAVPPREKVLLPRRKKEDKKREDPEREEERRPAEKPRDEDTVSLDITGGFQSEEEAQVLAAVLNLGPLPFPLKLVSHRVLDAPPEAPRDGR